MWGIETIKINKLIKNYWNDLIANIIGSIKYISIPN